MITLKSNNIFIPHKYILANKEEVNSSLIGLTFIPTTKLWKVLGTKNNILHVNRIFGTDFDLHKDKTTITEFMVNNNFSFIKAPYQHQIDALLNCNLREYFAYFLEPGLGKTKILIDDVCALYGTQKVDTVLVLAPKSVVHPWIREIISNSAESVVSCWPSPPPRNGNIRWYIMNPAALTTKSAMITKYQNQMRREKTPVKIKEIAEKIHILLAKNDDGMSTARRFLDSSIRTMMVIDESTIIANHKSTISKLCNELKLHTTYRRILTGDPIPNEPINIYNQMDWLDSSTVKHRNFYAFRNRYCIMGGFKNKQIVGYKNEKELSSILAAHGHRARTVDVLDMPEQNWIIRDIKPSDDTLRLYNDIINNDIVPLFKGQDTISATMALSKLIKLEQVCGGTLKGDNGKTHIIGNEKIKELLQMIKEFGNSSVLVWCHFRAEVDMLKENLKGYIVDTYHGNLSSGERQCVVDRFENKQIQILIVQDDTGHLGITLNAATYSVFYSNHRRPIVRNQAERRNWRIGQKFPIFYYDLLMGLVDTAGYKSLIKKRKRNYGITDRITKDELFKIVRPNENDIF